MRLKKGFWTMLGICLVAWAFFIPHAFWVLDNQDPLIEDAEGAIEESVNAILNTGNHMYVTGFGASLIMLFGLTTYIDTKKREK